jgi:ankyrin repeat protein
MLHQFPLHDAAIAGDTSAIRQRLAELGPAALESRDERGRTPLIAAADSPAAGVDALQVLLSAGAQIDAASTWLYEIGRTALSFAAQSGDPAKVATLIDAGAALHYSREGYGALLDALHGRDIRRDTRLLPLLRLLIERGVRLDDPVTPHHESPLRVLSHRGRFDAVELLLRAGADAAQLRWTGLMHAIAIGTLADMERELAEGDGLEARDFWSRTPLLLAIAAGDVDKVRWLLARGARRDAAGRCGKPPLFHAIENHDAAMLRFLIAEGFPIDQCNEFGTDALAEAAESGNADAVRLLIDAGLDPDARSDHTNALYQAQDPAIARTLLDLGADPANLPFETRRQLVGLPADPSTRLLDASDAEFQRGWRRRFGRHQAELVDEPFWRAMVRAGVDGYSACTVYSPRTTDGVEPVWCARRFGQSITFLPDGRVIQVAGEHEDSYDPDFCIYNDVFVHHPDGRFEIRAYPDTCFPPTDFHSATLIDDRVFLIGSLGYHGTRQHGHTPVYALHTGTLHIERIATNGDMPGWIYRHRARLVSPHEIRVFGGEIATMGEGKERHDANARVFVLDVRRREWRVEG